MRNMRLKTLLTTLILFCSYPGWTESLHQAVAENNFDSVKSQLENDVDINQLGHREYDYGSALHIAVQSGYQNIAKLLIDSGAVVDVRDHNELTPLHSAAWNGNLDMVKLLLKSGANITARDYAGFTPLSCAYENKQMTVVKYIESKLHTVSD